MFCNGKQRNNYMHTQAEVQFRQWSRVLDTGRRHDRYEASYALLLSQATITKISSNEMF